MIKMKFELIPLHKKNELAYYEFKIKEFLIQSLQTESQKMFMWDHHFLMTKLRNFLIPRILDMKY